ncbi:MAG TPA: glutamate racemase [Cyclobacteriaceae bacterium]|nr:glutamate racemase [Cyclobacteriaceae bacterium]
MPESPGPIGVFDSGIGGLTVFKEIIGRLPDYDYVYLGDNARVPYGTRSFETVYQYTRECVHHLFDMGCRLVIIACNTASAKALRTIQQRDLVHMPKQFRVLGVIRPTTEIVGNYSRSRHVGILATQGTVTSLSYAIEINKFFPDIQVYQEACPMWVPLVEANEHTSPGADYFVKKNLDSLLQKSPRIDTIILACTHYPLLLEKIRGFVPESITLLAQGGIVANSLADYLRRHPEIEQLCTQGKTAQFYTTESTEDFNNKAALFLGKRVESMHLQLQ